MPPRERRLEPLSQRLGRLFDGLGGRRWVKRQRVFLVQIGDLRLKRIEFTDAARAATKEAALQRLAQGQILPRPVALHHADLWVEFLEGVPVRANDTDLPECFAALLGALYATDPVRAEPAPGFRAADVRADLDVLVRAGVLARAEETEIARRLDDLMPSSLWTGFDHTDLLLKNMLRRSDGRLCLIDVESVVRGEAIGSGFAKAAGRWMGPRRDEFLEAARRRPEIPDFFDYFPYLEIRFLAAWTKRSLLLGKHKLVTPEPFREWIGRTSRATR